MRKLPTGVPAIGRKLPIPKKFQLLGHEIVIVMDKTLADLHGKAGLAQLPTNRLVLNDYEASGDAQTETEATCLHEILEMIRSKMGVKISHRDLDLLAEGLLQAYKTAEL